MKCFYVHFLDIFLCTPYSQTHVRVMSVLFSPLLARTKQSTSKGCLASSAQMPSYFQICQLRISTTASAQGNLWPLKSCINFCIFVYFSAPVRDPQSTWSDPQSTFRIPLHHMAWFYSELRHPSKKVVSTFQACPGFLSEGFWVAFHSNRAGNTPLSVFGSIGAEAFDIV